MDKEDIKVSIVYIIKDTGCPCQYGIRSILEETLSLFEIIVLDLSNSNETIDVIHDIQDNSVRYIKASSEFVELFKQGISQSKGEYISFLESDCVISADKLKKQYDYLKSNLDDDCVCTGVNFHDYCNFKIEGRYSSNELIYEIIFCNPVFFSSLMFRKSSLMRFNFSSGLYKGSNIFSNSYALLADMIMNNFKIGSLGEYLVSCKLQQRVPDADFKLQIMMIQTEFLNYIASEIVLLDSNAIDEINEYIALFENRQLDFDSLRLKIAALYKSKFILSKPPKSKRKILFCIPNLSHGGAEKQLITWLENLDYSLFEIDLLLFNKYGVYLKDIPTEVNWFTLDYFEKYSIKEYDIEVAFLEGSATKFIANRKTNAKKHAWVRTDLYNFHYTHVFFKDLQDEISCYRKFDKILFNGKESLPRFIERFGEIPVDKLVVYNLIDKQKIIRLSNEYSVKRNNEITLCCIGRLDAEKAYDRLLSVLGDLKDNGLSFYLWIIGEGSLRISLEETIRKLSLEENVTLLGFCDNPFPYLKGCDVFVHTSIAEGYANVVAEAICLGKPILATNTVGPSELLDDGRYGCLVKNDYREIYEALRELITNKELRDDLSKKALERSSIFDLNMRMKRIMEILS
ncbi:glycosyltransferase [Petrimonas sulfuriphila]|uniref:glycosyltransferase n=1 Tax=Petrimonas TaxID=307628 RepID=UPI002B37DF14|nr:glycosyltransferase [Petrimonas sp.]